MDDAYAHLLILGIYSGTGDANVPISLGSLLGDALAGMVRMFPMGDVAQMGCGMINGAIPEGHVAELDGMIMVKGAVAKMAQLTLRGGGANVPQIKCAGMTGDAKDVPPVLISPA